MKERIFQHPANRGVIDFLQHLARNWKRPLCNHPSETDDPYYTLGTHPDLVEKLWDKLTSGIPIDCRWVLYARPVLVCPDTGIVFAFATGTHTYAFRLPVGLRHAAKAEQANQQHRYPDGSVFDLGEYDPNWIFGGAIDDEDEACLIAFQSANDAS